MTASKTTTTTTTSSSSTASPPRSAKMDVAANVKKSEGLNNVFVEDLLEQMQSKFSKLGENLVGRMDDMGNRMDELEKSIAELMDEVGLEPPNGSRTASDEM